MFGLISAFITPLLWPFPHIISAIRMKGGEPPPSTAFKVTPYLDKVGTAKSCGAAFRNFLIAVFLIYGLYKDDEYPAFGRAYFLNFSWMWPIIVRNVVGTWLICGFWDWWLYFGPLKDTLFKYKIIKKYPSKAQMYHDIRVTTQASILAGLMEIVLCHLWATGAIPMAQSLWDKPILHLVLALTITHWRVPHFHFVHRIMHPWKINGIPDVGKFLYRHVHTVHHKSYNITAFSGTNMHPVEAVVYYSAALVCLPLGVHPSIAVGCFVDLAMGAWLGHDGHVSPAGGGNTFHTLHHMHFDCNYGSQLVPLDLWVGTFAPNREEMKKIWRGRDCGEESSETVIHTDSPSDKVE